MFCTPSSPAFLRFLVPKRALSLLCVLLFPLFGFSATLYWFGPGGGGNWNDVNNWSTTPFSNDAPNPVPVAGDNAIFSIINNENCNIDVPVSIASMLTVGYLGTITQNGNAVSITGSAIFTGGTFTGGNADITIGGDFTLGLNAFTSTSANLYLAGNLINASTFIHNSGTVIFNGAGGQAIIGNTAFNNFTSSKGGGSITSGAYTHTVAGATVISGGTLNTDNAAGIFNLQSLAMTGGSVAGSATGSVNVATTFSVPSGTASIGQCNFTVSSTSAITGALTLNSNTGVKTFIGTVTINAGGSWTSTTVSTTANLAFRAGMVHNGTSFSGGGVTFSTSPQTINGTSSVSFANDVEVTNRLGNQLASPFSLTIGGNLTGAGEYRHTFTNSILNIAGNVTVGFFTVTFNGNTVVYNGTGAQTLKGTAYHHLTINKSAGTATPNAAFTCAGDLTINNAGTLSSGTFTHSVTGTTSISAGVLSTSNIASIFNLQNLSMTGGSIAGAVAGTVNVATTFTIPSGTATINTCTFTVESTSSITGGIIFNINNSGLNTFKGTVTLNPGSVWNSSALTSTTANLVFRGGIVSNGSSFSAGSCRFNTVSPQTISGTTSLVFSNRLSVIAPVVLTNNLAAPASVSVGGDLSGGGTFIQGANSLLSIAGDAAINTLTASASPNTVTYNGSSAAQSVSGTVYDNLILNNSFGTSPQFTPTGSYTVNNTLTMTDGNMNLSTFTVTIGTAVGMPGTLDHSAGTAGWMYNGMITRWFNTVTIADGGAAGLFPIGISVNYRPFYVSFPITPPSAGGTINLSYTDASTTTAVAVVDAPGTIQIRHNAFWIISNGNSFTAAASATEFRAEPNGLVGIADVNDLRLMLSASTIGTLGTNGGSPASPIIRRVAIPAYGPGTISRNLFVGSIDASASPLPVEFLSFSAAPAGAEVTVSWSTASESNSDHFIVQRSQHGINFSATGELASDWEDVAQVQAAGNSSTIKNYASVDPEPYAGISYYRLKQVDIDGKFVFSSIVAVNMNGNDLFSVYPNPASGPFHAVLSGKKGDHVRLTVKDVLGKEVYSNQIVLSDDKMVFAVDPAGRLAGGVYLVTATSNDKIFEQMIVIR